MKKSLYLVIAIILLIMGCNKNSTNPTNSKVLIPLTVGNKWVYNWYLYDSLGKSKLVCVEYKEVFKDSIIYEIHWGNIKDSIYDFRISSGHTDYYFLANKSDGSYYKALYQDPWREWKYPGSKGDTFLSNGVKRIIEEINYQNKVAIGSFNCYKYSYSFTGIDKYIFYFSPDIGEILEEFYEYDILVSKTELISYTIK